MATRDGSYSQLLHNRPPRFVDWRWIVTATSLDSPHFYFPSPSANQARSTPMTCHVVGLMVPFSRLPDFCALSCHSQTLMTLQCAVLGVGLLDVELSKSQFCTFARSQLLILCPPHPLFTPPTTLRCTFAGREMSELEPNLEDAPWRSKDAGQSATLHLYNSLFFCLATCGQNEGKEGKGELQTEHK